MTRLTGAVAFALATVLLTTASAQPTTTPPPVRTGSQTVSAGPEPVQGPRAQQVPSPAPAAPAPSAVVPAAVPVTASATKPAEDSGCDDGVLELAVKISCTNVDPRDEHVYTLTTTRPGPITYRWTMSDGYPYSRLDAVVKDAAGQIICRLESSWTREPCQVGAQGTYTLVVANPWPTQPGYYTLMADYLTEPVRPCATLEDDFHVFGEPGITGRLRVGELGDCFRIDQPEGTRLLLASSPVSEYSSTRRGLWAADHSETCTDSNVDLGPVVCTLTGPGPYIAWYWVAGSETEYTLRLPRLTNPAGCTDVPVGAVGDGGAQAVNSAADTYIATCHTVAAQAGLHLFRVVAEGSTDVRWTVHDRAGAQVCKQAAGDNCVLPAAGRYTLLVTHRLAQSSPYQAGVIRVDGVTGCAAPMSVNFDTPGVSDGFTPVVQANCHEIDAKPGDRILKTSIEAAKLGSGDATHTWVVNGDGKTQCATAADPCVLDGPGPFLLLATALHWMDENLSYRARVTRLNGATGCPQVAAGEYGTIAGQPTGMNCRALRVPAAGTYKFAMLSSSNSSAPGTVYDSTGAAVCTFGRVNCVFPAAGTYTAVLWPDLFETNLEFERMTVFLPLVPGAGCVDVSDQGTATYRGSFPQYGEIDCLRLPTPAGATIAASLPDDAVGSRLYLDGTVVDAAGTSRCTLHTLKNESCTLSGPAPFYLILSPSTNLLGPYVLSIIRVDGAANGCKALPTGDPGLTLSFTKADRNLGCVTVPAGAHAANERIHWRRLTGSGDTRARIFDAAGKQLCRTSAASVVGELTCALPAGPVTVVLVPDDADARYRVSRSPA